ncbi:MAG: family 1 glycosylhydrolase [Myxococcota bacterium]|jgi:beta-glucosidase
MTRALLASCLALAACTARPGLDAGEPSLATLGKGLPKGFLMGTATAAHQVEGGNDNDWTDWEAGRFPDGTPHVVGGAQSGLACDSWNRFNDDLAAMQALGAKTYRFSVEWSRLEPTEGAWDAAAMARYREWTVKLRAAGIEPMVTLHHFTLPKWVAARKGFETTDTQAAFEAFARRVGEALGDTVDLWCPFNEINVYAVQGYLAGVWPPGVKDDTALQVTVMANMLKAHAKAAAALREVDTVDADGDGKPTVLTTAHHVRVFQPASHSLLDTAIAGLTDDVANEAVPRALKTGRIRFSVPGTIEIDEQVDGLAGSIDVLGLNYYTRDIIRADLSSAALSNMYERKGRPTNDLGWDLYPDGLYLFLKRFSSYGWPVFITENGTADAADAFRTKYLAQHVAAIELAVKEGVDVRGYYHWSLIDNFEWAEGYSARFGLFRVDFDGTRDRTPTSAVDAFRAIEANIPK